MMPKIWAFTGMTKTKKEKKEKKAKKTAVCLPYHAVTAHAKPRDITPNDINKQHPSV